jgi:mono/diheme cytochrome c family protein
MSLLVTLPVAILTALGALTPPPASHGTAPQAPQGAALYQRCATCHQANGAGIPGAFPPLAGSEWVTGNAEVPIRIVLKGLQGAITVKGQPYNSVMMAYGTGQEMSDAEVAAVVSYVRANFGNKAPAVTAAQVAAVRKATAKQTTPWNAADLQPLLKK